MILFGLGWLCGVISLTAFMLWESRRLCDEYCREPVTIKCPKCEKGFCKKHGPMLVDLCYKCSKNERFLKAYGG